MTALGDLCRCDLRVSRLTGESVFIFLRPLVARISELGDCREALSYLSMLAAPFNIS